MYLLSHQVGAKNDLNTAKKRNKSDECLSHVMQDGDCSSFSESLKINLDPTRDPFR